MTYVTIFCINLCRYLCLQVGEDVKVKKRKLMCKTWNQALLVMATDSFLPVNLESVKVQMARFEEN